MLLALSLSFSTPSLEHIITVGLYVVSFFENIADSTSVGFPVVNRYVWGMYGSQFIIWNRILLSLGNPPVLQNTPSKANIIQYG